MIADNAGFNDPSFVSSSGALVEGLVNRSSFAPGKPGTLSALVNDLYKKKNNVDLDDASARAMQGMLILADAINPGPARLRKFRRRCGQRISRRARSLPGTTASSSTRRARISWPRA